MKVLTFDLKDDLAGECDFLFALHPSKPFIDTPIISLTEAKEEDMEYGVGECAAQMMEQGYAMKQKAKIFLLYTDVQRTA